MTPSSQVLAGQRAWSCEPADAYLFLGSLPSASVDLVLTSPPYEDARTYGIGFKRRGQVWVDWMRPILVEADRVSRGLVLVNMAGKVRDWRYSPVVEWLVSDLTRHDGLVCGPSPYAWVKQAGIPGSGSKHYQRRDWEPVYAFCLPDRLPLAWSDNTAFGHTPKWAPGGEMSHRLGNGDRRNRSKAAPCGSTEGDFANTGYTVPKLANPGNVIRTNVGGGQLGHPMAHENEAPFPLALTERFVRWFCPPGGVVCDPFAGSGTTGHAALIHGRRFIGCDARLSQVDLAERRLDGVVASIQDQQSKGRVA